MLASDAEAWTISISGTIYQNPNGGDQGDQNGIFVPGNSQPPGASMIGLPYTETITTDPYLNGDIEVSNSLLTATGWTVQGTTAAPYDLTTTVNGVSFTNSDLDPFWNRAYLLSGLKPALPTPEDQLNQEVQSAGCGIGYGPCLRSFITATSYTTDFVKKLDFSHPIHPAGLDTSSNIFFYYRNGPLEQGTVQEFTTFWGSISTISVDPRGSLLTTSNLLESPTAVPLPAAFPLFASGVSVIGYLGWRNKQKSTRHALPPNPI
jgi:hypothetical protein